VSDSRLDLRRSGVWNGRMEGILSLSIVFDGVCTEEDKGKKWKKEGLGSDQKVSVDRLKGEG